MPTVLDVLKDKGPKEIFYTDIRKLDGTVLHIWKQRNEEFLSKIEQKFGDKKMLLIEFPIRFLGTIESVMKYHFEKKENNIQKAQDALKEKERRLEQKQKKAENKFRKTSETPSQSKLTSNIEQPKRRKRKRIIRKVVKKIDVDNK